MALGGSSSQIIKASVRECFEAASDFERAHEWQQSTKGGTVVERDERGRASVVEAEFEAIVTTARLRLRISYDEPRSNTVVREAGDLKSLRAVWTFEDLGDETTKATYEIELDPGRMLSIAAKGPAGAQLRKLLADQPPRGLKAYVEGRG